METYSIKQIFTNPKIEQEVKEIHDYLESLQMGTLFEFFIMGMSWSREKCQHIFKDRTVEVAKIKSYMLNGLSGDFKQFGIYTMPECSGYMWRRSDFIHSLYKEYGQNKFDKIFNTGTVVNPLAVTMAEIREISIRAIAYPSLVLPIKLFLIKHKMTEDYDGIQAYTTPVDRATQFLFNINFNGDQFRHTVFCREIAQEIGRSPTFINTVLWKIGQKI